MTLPIIIRTGWIQVTVSPPKGLDNPEVFQETTKPEELSLCWTTLKHIVDRIIDIQIGRCKSVVEQNEKTMTIVDIYNRLHSKIAVDETLLLNEVLKTGNFSEDEAKLLIRKVKEEKVDNGMAWY